MAQGPPPRVVAVHPAPGAGTECGLDAPDDCGVPTETTLELRFDRYLLPATAIRQSVSVYTGSEELSVFVQPEYDLVERVVVYRLPKGTGLEPGTRYSVRLLSPASDQDFGFRAFDGAPLGEGDIPLEFDFRTRKAPTTPAPPPEPAFPDTCSLLEALAPGDPPSQHAGCSDANCHAGDSARMGLRLDSAAGLLQTAIDRVAHQTESGARTGRALENPPRLGVNMPVIERGRPDNSYLMYKLLRNPQNFRGNPGVGCVTTHQVPLPPGTCPEPEPAESERLARWFVRGLPMPHNDRSADLRGLQSFIRDTTLKLECSK